MDWATFIKDNSQSLFTLGGVFLGSAITFLISYLNNRFQARERDKDREEARREAKTQLALELTSNDVKIINDKIDRTLESLAMINIISAKRDFGKISYNEMMEELQKESLDANSKSSRMFEIEGRADKIAFSLGDEFVAELHQFDEKYSECVQYVVKGFSFDLREEEETELQLEVIRCAGRLHNLLKDKLISIRDV